MHRSRAWKARLALSTAVCLGATLSYASASQPGPTPTEAEVLAQISKIKSESPSLQKEVDGSALAIMVKHQDFMLIRSSEIDAIAVLLSDNDDVVRGYAAIALGNIGPPARRAAPQLMKAFRERECQIGDLTSTDAMLPVFSRIGEPRPELRCPPR